MKRIFASFLLILGLPLTVAVSGAAPAAAQDILRAAAVINDEVISVLDLDMRLRLAVMATGQTDSAQLRKRMTPQIIRALIDERLQSQEAKRLGITVTEEMIATTAEEIAHWIAVRLRDEIVSADSSQIESIRVEVEENFGQWAVCELPID